MIFCYVTIRGSTERTIINLTNLTNQNSEDEIRKAFVKKYTKNLLSFGISKTRWFELLSRERH